MQPRAFFPEREKEKERNLDHINFDPSTFDFENAPSWARPRDPHSGRFLTKKEIEELKRRVEKDRERKAAEEKAAAEKAAQEAAEKAVRDKKCEETLKYRK